MALRLTRFIHVIFSFIRRRTGGGGVLRHVCTFAGLRCQAHGRFIAAQVAMVLRCLLAEPSLPSQIQPVFLPLIDRDCRPGGLQEVRGAAADGPGAASIAAQGLVAKVRVDTCVLRTLSLF